MPDYTEQPQNTFVIRFWWEWQGAGSDQAVGWRGRVEHVQSGEGMAFREMRQLLAFIEAFVPFSPTSPSNGKASR
ncbi:MAG: hypothetical protein QME94_06780 [Anaerolineae bacterium]|nr:hypothetical protein [Anaerolineae bacterium]